MLACFMHVFVGPEDLWLTERPLRQTITGADVLKKSAR